MAVFGGRRQHDASVAGCWQIVIDADIESTCNACDAVGVENFVTDFERQIVFGPGNRMINGGKKLDEIRARHRVGQHHFEHVVRAIGGAQLSSGSVGRVSICDAIDGLCAAGELDEPGPVSSIIMDKRCRRQSLHIVAGCIVVIARRQVVFINQRERDASGWNIAISMECKGQNSR